MVMLAQLNLARFRYAWSDRHNWDFLVEFDRIMAQAAQADGFVWAHGGGDSPTMLEKELNDTDLLVNLSVWRDFAALEAFVYRQADHRMAMARRRRWFVSMRPNLVLWWVPDGHQPSVDEGLARLRLLDQKGPSERAFTFRWHQEQTRRGLPTGSDASQQSGI